MGVLFEAECCEAVSCKEVVIPEWAPRLYISEHDDLYAFCGIAMKGERGLELNSIPYYWKSNHSYDLSADDGYLGAVRLCGGALVIERFIDDFGLSGLYKESSCWIRFPRGSSTWYGVESSEHVACESMTRQVFGLARDELEDVLAGYDRLFALATNRWSYPRITRSTSRDNCCDLSGNWIPQNFPYISFAESDYMWSHVSLSAFYLHLGMLLAHGSRSPIWKALVELGVQESNLNRVVEIDGRFHHELTHSIPYDLLHQLR